MSKLGRCFHRNIVSLQRVGNADELHEEDLHAKGAGLGQLLELSKLCCGRPPVPAR